MFESFFLFASLLESQIQINRFPLWGGRGLISVCHHKVILTVSKVTCPLIYQGCTVVNGDACWGTMEQPLTHSGLGGRGGHMETNNRRFSQTSSETTLVWRKQKCDDDKCSIQRLLGGVDQLKAPRKLLLQRLRVCSTEVSNSSVVPSPTVHLNLAF